MFMRPWCMRPTEIAHLFNPAFNASLLHKSVLAYNNEVNYSMPFPMSYLILPIVLHSKTRQILPKRVTTKMHTWIVKNQIVKMGFSNRASQLAGYTREALLFGFRLGIINLTDNAGLVSHKHKHLQSWPKDSDAYECVVSASFIGRWFGVSGGMSSVFSMWGIF